VIWTSMRPKALRRKRSMMCRCVTMRVTRVIEPCLLVISDRVNDQRVALPSPDGVPEPGGLGIDR
jgi:hypothetical protein